MVTWSTWKAAEVKRSTDPRAAGPYDTVIDRNIHEKHKMAQPDLIDYASVFQPCERSSVVLWGNENDTL